jgi:uncharacterized protein YcgI (DUF1989 family)
VLAETSALAACSRNSRIRKTSGAEEDIPSPFNIFQETRIDGTTGKMEVVCQQLAEPAQIELIAEIGLSIGISACPGAGRGLPVDAFVFASLRLQMDRFVIKSIIS